MLIDKTKDELISIILRKDEVHKSLNKTIEEKDNELLEVKLNLLDKTSNLVKVKARVEELDVEVDNYRDLIDEYTTETYILQRKLAVYRISTIAIVGLLLSLLFM